MAKAKGLEIVAVPLTGAGYAYLQKAWKGVLEGGLGQQKVKADARVLIKALHQVATGGRLDSTINVTGGTSNELDALLDESIAQTNEVNKLLGEIKIFS